MIKGPGMAVIVLVIGFVPRGGCHDVLRVCSDPLNSRERIGEVFQYLSNGGNVAEAYPVSILAERVELFGNHLAFGPCLRVSWREVVTPCLGYVRCDEAQEAAVA